MSTSETITSQLKEYRRFQWRSSENRKAWFTIEKQLFLKEWKILLPCAIVQYIHGIFHNVAYYMQAHTLSTEQRVTLYDLGFDILPELSRSTGRITEFLVFGGVFLPMIAFVLSVIMFQQNPNHPRYLVLIFKRGLLHVSFALTFRVISFLVTALPSPADHCELKYNPECLIKNPDTPLLCVIENPLFNPPTISEFFWKMDVVNGCGDLMFSSHTIYTLSFILLMNKYWPNKFLLPIMGILQIIIAILIVAARKHYSLDVFSALYIVPLLWLVQEAYLHDINNKDVIINKESIMEYYNVDITPDIVSNGYVDIDRKREQSPKGEQQTDDLSYNLVIDDGSKNNVTE